MSDTDPLVERTEEAAESQSAARAAQAANLFDLRRIIGGVFGVWGILLIILGIGDSDAEIAKAADLNINLITGLGMIALSAMFLIWAFTRPLGQELAEAEGGDSTGTASDEGGGRAGEDLPSADRGDDPRPE